jgi:hypothetical protein
MAAVLAALMVMASASAVFAGEVNGNGEVTGAVAHANSICAYSGQNDGNPPDGRVQSYGQDVREGRANPHEFGPGKGTCRGGTNPNRG